MPTPILSEENAQWEVLAKEARTIIKEFLKNDAQGNVLSPEGRVMTDRIFQIFLSQSARFPDPSLFVDWLQQDVALDHPSSEAVVKDIVTLYEDGSMLIDLVRKAAQMDAREAQNALRGWLESYECDDMVNRARSTSDEEALKNSRFYNLVKNLLEGSTGIRAQMIAVFDMYCETGWAARDWTAAIRGEEDGLPEGVKAWLNVMKNPTATPEEKIKVFEQRIQELLVDVRVSPRFAGDETFNYYLATTGKTTRFSFTGKSWGNGAVGLVMPFAADESKLLVAEVMAGKMRFTDVVGKNFSSIQGALLHGHLSGRTQAGSPVEYKSAAYRSYLSPMVVAPENSSIHDDLKDALGSNIRGMHALNTLQLLVDGYPEGSLQYTFEAIIKASLKPLGAVSHWENMEVLYSDPVQRLTKACEVIVDVADALAQIGEHGPHLKGLDMLRQTNGKPAMAVKALHLALSGAMNSVNFNEEHQALLRSMSTSMERLLPLLEKLYTTHAKNLRNDMEQLNRPLQDRVELKKQMARYGAVLRAAYAQEHQQTMTRQTFQALSKKPPFKGYRVNGMDHFVPSDTDCAGALDQLASSTAPAVHRWLAHHAQDLGHLGMEQVKQWAHLILETEGPAHFRAWATLPVATAHLDRAMNAMNQAWQKADLIDSTDRSSSIKTLMGQNFVEHLQAGLSHGLEHFETLPERIEQVQRVIQARHLDTPDEHRQALKNRLVQIAGACTDLGVIRALCDHLAQPFDKDQGIPFVQMLGEGRFRNDPLALPSVPENLNIDADDLRAWLDRAIQPTTAPIPGKKPHR